MKHYIMGVYLAIMIIIILPFWVLTVGIYKLGKYYNEIWYERNGRNW